MCCKHLIYLENVQVQHLNFVLDVFSVFSQNLRLNLDLEKRLVNICAT